MLRILHVAVVVACFVTAAGAEVITDPVGDFLPTFTGPQNGDLDVVSAEVFFNGSSFLFTSTSAAPIGTTPGGVFVWGVNRGAGFATFPVIAPGVTFDAVAIIVPGGNSFVLDLATNMQSPIAAGDVTFSGTDLAARVQLSQLPSLGAAPADYTVNLWPRSELQLIDEVISDFAPDNSNAAVTVIPEPATIALLGLGLGVLVCRRRQPYQCYKVMTKFTSSVFSSSVSPRRKNVS